MRLYALTELHDPEAIELFITDVGARRALELHRKPYERKATDLKLGAGAESSP
jgi:hypothetical protein